IFITRDMQSVVHILCSSATPKESENGGLYEWKLQDQEWKLLEKLEIVFEVFEPVTIKLSTSSYPTVHFVLPYFDRLLTVLESFAHDSGLPQEIRLACQ